MIPDTSAQDRPLSSTAATPAWRRWLWPAAGTLVVLALGGWVASSWSAGSRSYDSARIRIAEVTRGDLVRDISADGRVITANSPILYAIAAGTVSLKVVAGDVVKKDQVLAVIDSPELRSRLVQEESTLAGMEAEASRAQLDAQIASLNARKARDQAQIDHTAAMRDLERLQRGHAGGAVSQNELARAQDEMEKARIGLETAREDAGLQGQGAVLDARNKRLLADRQKAVVAELQRQVDALTLRAPFDGQVGQVQVPQGTNVAVNAPVLSVVDLSEFELEIRVPESFARDLGIGVPAQVTSQGKPWPAKVSAVSPEVVNGEVTARLRFEEGRQPPGLRQNQRLSARIVLDTRKNVLMVERGPFVEQGGGHTAWVVEGRSAQRRPVQTGVSSLGHVEIVAGAQEGDRIVVSGADQFGDAERVAIK